MRRSSAWKPPAGAPAGRVYHCAFEADGLIQVFDVWESQESFEAFGATLVPIMTELGADAGQPMIATVRNIIVGTSLPRRLPAAVERSARAGNARDEHPPPVLPLCCGWRPRTARNGRGKVIVLVTRVAAGLPAVTIVGGPGCGQSPGSRGDGWRAGGFRCRPSRCGRPSPSPLSRRAPSHTRSPRTCRRAAHRMRPAPSRAPDTHGPA